MKTLSLDLLPATTSTVEPPQSSSGSSEQFDQHLTRAAEASGGTSSTTSAKPTTTEPAKSPAPAATSTPPAPEKAAAPKADKKTEADPEKDEVQNEPVASDEAPAEPDQEVDAEALAAAAAAQANTAAAELVVVQATATKAVTENAVHEETSGETKPQPGKRGAKVQKVDGEPTQPAAPVTARVTSTKSKGDAKAEKAAPAQTEHVKNQEHADPAKTTEHQVEVAATGASEENAAAAAQTIVAEKTSDKRETKSSRDGDRPSASAANAVGSVESAKVQKSETQATPAKSPDMSQALDDADAGPKRSERKEKSAAPEQTDAVPAQDNQDPSDKAAGASPNRDRHVESRGAVHAAEQRSAGNETSSMPHVDRARFVQRVAKAFTVAQERGAPLRLRLSPPELGAVKIEISLRDGAMTAKVEAETATARGLLLDNLPQLRERLAEQSIQIEHFDVDLMDRRGSDSSGSMSEGADQNSSRWGDARPARGELAQQEASRIEVPSATAKIGGGGQLNVIV